MFPDRSGENPFFKVEALAAWEVEMTWKASS